MIGIDRLSRVLGSVALRPAVAMARPAVSRRRWAVKSVIVPRWIDWVLLVVLLSIAALAHGINMLHFPYFFDDEGIYLSQAWAVSTQGSLAPYTYWYDHAPAGWILIAGWTLLTGGFETFGTSVAGGRVFMLVLQIVSTGLVYWITLWLSGRRLAGAVAVLLFALSPLGIVIHRQVMLDNITVAWVLGSIALVAAPHFSLRRAWLSAALLGVAVLSKELTVFLLPGMAYFVSVRSHPSYRWIATSTWILVAASVISLWVLMAVLKQELFPTGTFLGGTHEHVSLLGTLQFQASRAPDGGILQADSQFWISALNWSRDDVVLVAGGAIAAILSLLFFRTRREIAILGFLTLSLVAFLARGGIVIGFYVGPLLPLLAINIALLMGVGLDTVQRIRWKPGFLGPPTSLAVLAAVMVGMVPNYTGQNADAMRLWTSREADAQVQALGWVRRYLSPETAMMVDSSLWTDLHGGSGGVPSYSLAHYYYKMGRDPDIRDDVFNGDWRNVDYAVVTPSMGGDISLSEMVLPNRVFANSDPVTRFDTGGWPQEIRRVARVGRQPAADDQMLVAAWQDYRGRFITQGRVIDPATGATTSEGGAYALLQSVYVDDRATFDEVWAWTEDHMAVRGDDLLASTWSAGRVEDLDSASDADVDAALALVLAARQWGDPGYARAAERMLVSIWEHETVLTAHGRLVRAGSWTTPEGIVWNPSYFAPYAYRAFASFDEGHDWESLVSGGYEMLASIQDAADLGGPAGVVPNWVIVDPATGAPRSASEVFKDADVFSYDASRVPWRLAIDWLWSRDQRARQALSRITLPARELQATGRLMAAYNLDGTAATEIEATSMYAGVVPGLLVNGDVRRAHQTFSEEVLGPLIGTDPTAAANYYDANWAWFTLAVMNGGWADLSAGRTSIDWAAAADR